MKISQYCCCTYFRNADKSSRPDFAELVHALSSPTTDLLSWSEEDMRVHPQAAVLGAPLEAGIDLYPELQRTYMHNQQLHNFYPMHLIPVYFLSHLYINRTRCVCILYESFYPCSQLCMMWTFYVLIQKCMFKQCVLIIVLYLLPKCNDYVGHPKIQMASNRNIETLWRNMLFEMTSLDLLILPSTPDTLHLGCSYHLLLQSPFSSTWSVLTLEK